MWLDKLVEATRQRVDEGYYDERPDLAEEARLGPLGSLAAAIEAADPAIVAEIKPARPEGTTFPVDVATQADLYANGGACAISVLTDPDHFGGALANLHAARSAGLPLVMKDFLVDRSQLEAARAWGASAVLAIARLPREGYTDYTLGEACRDAHELGLEVLAEIVTEAELEDALAADADVLGINVRDLDTLDLDPDRVGELLAGRSLERPTLQLSDVSSRADVEDALASGADGVLVGTHLMEAEDPTAALEKLAGVQR